jgi:hypothetical protein
VLLYDARRHFFVTLNAGTLFRSSKYRRAQKKNKTQYKLNPDILHADVPPFSDMIARACPSRAVYLHSRQCRIDLCQIGIQLRNATTLYE